MKKALHLFSLAVVLLVALAAWGLYRPVVSSAHVTLPLTFDGFPPDQARTIDFSGYEEPDAETETTAEPGASLTDSERHSRDRKRRDQLRDWILLTLVSATNLSAQELNQTLYDLPAQRHDNLRQIANFEYGETRSRIVNNNQVIALIPVATAAERADHLAHIADEQRKNLGEIPAQFIVFEYEFHPAENDARITRRETLPGAELFTAQFGYHERPIRELKDCEAFMAQVDDLTFARRTKEGLVFGGRKLQAHAGRHPFRGVQLEHVAALWRSERGLTGFRSSGFSLDSMIDLVKFGKEFDTSVAPTLRVFAGISAGDLAQFKTLLEQIETEQKKAAPKDQENVGLMAQAIFLQAIGSLCEASPAKEQCKKVVDHVGWQYRFQKATYFGELQGTEVGMSLFYTDLLMKLWGLDFVESAPRRIRDFPIEAQIKVSPIYKKEVEELPGTRFWFAPLEEGVQVAEGGETLLFARNATKIFVRPHDFMNNSDRPDASEPNIFNRTFVNWWNDHYEEIARYEPEYERLNEIMKWSQVAGWLNAAQQLDQLKFLEPVRITRTNRFDHWVRQHPELTFRDWDKVGFYEPSEKGVATEALATLRSKEFPFFDTFLHSQGGVSLAGRATFVERAALSQRIAAVARRGGVDYRLSDLAAGRLRTLEATEYQFRSFASQAAETLARARPTVRLRGDVGELANVQFQRTINRTTDGLLLRTRAVNTDFGDLAIARTARGYQVGWQSREVALGQSLARRLSTAEAPEMVLLRDPRLESVIKLADESAWLIRARGGERWIRLSAGNAESSALESGSLYRVAGFGDKAKPINVTWVDDATVQGEMKGQGYLVISGEEGAEGGVRMNLVSQGPPTTAREIQVSGSNVSFKASVDGPRGVTYVRWKDLPTGVRDNPHLIPRYVRNGKIELPSYNRMTRNLEARDYNTAARELARDPVAFQTRLNQRLADELRLNNELLRHREFALARRQLDDLIQLHGHLPDLKMRQAVVELQAGRIERAVSSMQETLPLSLRQRPQFLDEINQRLANQALNATERNNLLNVARYAEWREARLAQMVEGRLVPVAEQNRLLLKLEVRELTQRKLVVLPDELASDKALLYVQDSPGLNHLDAVPATLPNSLRPLITANRVQVYELEMTGISHFRPALIYESRTQLTVRLSARNNVQINRYVPYTRLSPCPPEIVDCRTEEEKEKQRRIYVVVEK